LQPGPRKIVYIAGANRSGTTVLCQAIGAVDRYFACGEIHNSWSAYANSESCSCGNLVRDCRFWGELLNSRDSSLRDDMVELKRRFSRIRHLPTYLLRKGRIDEDPKYRRYRDAVLALYVDIWKRTGGRVVVDSSHLPIHGALLAAAGEFDVYVVHLVRDSRAVAHSNLRQKAIFGASDSKSRMPRVGPTKSTLRWLYSNIFAELYLRRYRYRRLMYRDFCADPQGCVRQIVEWVGEGTTARQPISGHSLRLGEHHLVCGNPVRGKSGEILIKEDDAWYTDLAFPNRILVGMLSFPLLWRYGLLNKSSVNS